MRQKRILLAEDIADTRELLREDLEGAGLHVDAVSNGLAAVEQALAAIQAGRPYDLALLDLAMPELDGCGALRST